MVSCFPHCKLHSFTQYALSLNDTPWPCNMVEEQR